MRKIVTSFLVLFSVLSMMAQDDIIRNGGFENGLTDSTQLKYLDDWYMDKDSPESGWWGDALDRHVTLSSGDSATLYQVVETISADSMFYELSMFAGDSWNTGSVVVIASISDADTSIRTVYMTDTIPIDSANFGLNFGFSDNSGNEGKKLIIEFTCTPADIGEGAAWTNFDDISLIKRIPGVNNPPVADAGDAQSAKGETLVTLDGSGSYDPDDDDITYNWISTFPGIVLSDPNVVDPTFTAPDVNELTTYTFALYVNDGTVNSDTAMTSVTVIPKGELIRNGDFQEKVAGADPESTSLKDIAFWNIDAADSVLGGGIWGPMVTLSSQDPNFYQVIREIGPGEATYSLSFSGRSSWNCHAIKTIFSISEADSTLRTAIDSNESVMGIDPGSGINTTVYATFKHVLSIPANSDHVGKKLILELQNIAYDDGANDGWCEIEFVSLVVEEVATSVNSDLAEQLIVYPNPASKTLYIQGAQVSELYIYSILGKMERSIVRPDIEEVDVEGLDSGIYILKMTTDKGVVNKKIRVQ